MGEEQKKIRVLIVDDSQLARQLLSEVVKSDPEFEVVGLGTNGREAVDLAKSL